MRITEVKTHQVGHVLDEPFESSFSLFEHRRYALVEIRCDNGLTGWGECLGPAALNAAVVQAMAGRLVGQDARSIEPIWLELYSQFRDQGQRGIILTALSGIDIALWDLAGQYRECPVYELMGGTFRDSVPAYATGGFRVVGRERADTLVEEARAALEAGFEAIKIKIGFGVEADLEAIGTVRDAIGPKVALMIDANHGYDRLNAQRLGNGAEQFDLAWFEEPVVPEDLDGYRQLRTRQPLAIAGGETWHGRWAIAQALKADAVDILQPDVCGIGGLSEARKVLTLADVAQVRVVPHVWGTGIAMAAALQFHAILPPSPPAFETQSVLFEFDRTPNPLRDALLVDPIHAEQGKVAIPEGYGLGVTINPDALQHFTSESA